MEIIARIIFPLIYFALGIAQLLALVSGIQELGIHWLLSGLFALIVAYIPVIGALGGIYGAVEGWGWPLWQALALFVGPYVVLFTIVGVITALEKKPR